MIVSIWCRVARFAHDKKECTPYARRKPDWVVHGVLRLKVLMGANGCRKIATTFNRLHQAQSHTVGKSFVAHCIQTHQHALVQLRREMHRQRPRPVPVNAVLNTRAVYTKFGTPSPVSTAKASTRQDRGRSRVCGCRCRNYPLFQPKALAQLLTALAQLVNKTLAVTPSLGICSIFNFPNFL
jgi:hypothetical protein